MKKYQMILFALSILTCVSFAPAYADEKTPVKATTQPMGEALIKKIMERATPSETENINILTPLAGTWDYSAVVWTMPGVKLQQSTGKVTNDMILENRFLSSVSTGSLNIGGHDILVKGQWLIGYDNAKKSFTSVWVDTMSTGMMIGNGEYDEKENAIKETGRFTNPLNGNDEKFRSELKFTDTAHYKRTIFTIDKSGKESKLMEIEYSKKN